MSVFIKLNTMKIKILSVLMLVGLGLIYSCADEEVVVENYYYPQEDYSLLQKYLNLPSSPFDYDLDFPDYITSFVRTEVNQDVATLGRVLFYDTQLSSDNSVSCASCHKPELAFSDDVSFSKGAEGKVTTRNSLALGSVINFSLYYGDDVFNGIPFFWDNSATTIQEQSARTIANPNEMNLQMHQVASRVNDLEYYTPLAKMAFGTENLSQSQILDAIATFTNAITTYDSRFDQALEKEFNKGFTSGYENRYFESFSALENLGKDLYMANCSSCHGVSAGRPGKLAGNNGLYTSYSDKGAGSSGAYAEFKIPTLRNILKTAPYMHDGSLITIDDVLDHYSSEIEYNSGLSPELRTGSQAKKFNFSEAERDALKAFFATMTDETIETKEKYLDPFK